MTGGRAGGVNAGGVRERQEEAGNEFNGGWTEEEETHKKLLQTCVLACLLSTQDIWVVCLHIRLFNQMNWLGKLLLRDH